MASILTTANHLQTNYVTEKKEYTADAVLNGFRLLSTADETPCCRLIKRLGEEIQRAGKIEAISRPVKFSGIIEITLGRKPERYVCIKSSA